MFVKTGRQGHIVVTKQRIAKKHSCSLLRAYTNNGSEVLIAVQCYHERALGAFITVVSRFPCAFPAVWKCNYVSYTVGIQDDV